MLVGPISSVMVNKFGPRLTCIGKQEFDINLDKKANIGEQKNKIDPNKQIHPCSWSLCFCAAIFVSTFSPNVYMLMVSIIF